MIRISASYLFNIFLKDNNQNLYLLVKSERRNQYQPIGGCYRYFDSANSFLESIGFIPEKKSNGVDSVSDLRLVIPKDNVEEFVNWYNLGVDRETSFERELNEELVDKLDEKDKGLFRKLKCTLLKKGSFDIFFDEEKEINSIKPMDIIGLELNERQIKCIKRLVKDNQDMFILATELEIHAGEKSLNDGNKAKIGSHSKNILVDKPLKRK